MTTPRMGTTQSGAPMPREDFIRILQQAVNAGSMTQEQFDQALAAFDSQSPQGAPRPKPGVGPGTARAQGRGGQGMTPESSMWAQPGAPSISAAAGPGAAGGVGNANAPAGSLPGEDQITGMQGGLPAGTLQITPQQAVPFWTEQTFGGVAPGFRETIGKLAAEKYWPWLMTRWRLPGMEAEVGAEDFRSFLNREMGGAGFGPGGRQGTYEDLMHFGDIAAQANPPAVESDPTASLLYWALQPNQLTGIQDLDPIMGMLGGAAGSTLPRWIKGAFNQSMGSLMNTFQGNNPMARATDFFGEARRLGIV